MEAIDTARSLGEWVSRTSLAGSLRGRLLTPGQEGYDASRRVWNTRFDRQPSMVVRAADVTDVVRTVRHARQAGLPLAVRSGGHSLAGHGTGDGAVVLDLHDLRGLHIDVDRREAWAQPGLTCGEYTKATHVHGLATPFGDTGSVGLGGITVGGGIGWLARKHGLTIDSLLSAEVVTADGRVLNASRSENPELFWALRGGGGNFGVVTRFRYRLHPVSEVLGGAIFLPATPEVLRRLVPAALSAPDELTVIATLMRLPPLPFLAPQHHGHLGLIVAPVHAGDPTDGERALAAIRALATPLADTVRRMPYPDVYAMNAKATRPAASLTRSMFMDALDADTIESVLTRLSSRDAPAAMAQIRPLGGAMSRVAADATAFAHRASEVMLTLITHLDRPADAAVHADWTDALWSSIRGAGRGAYVNFLEDEGASRVAEAYPGPTFERLARAKRTYDPGNLFHLNQNIPPA